MSRRKRSKRWISWLIIVILLIVAGVVCYLVWDNYFNNKKKDEYKELDTSKQIEAESNDIESSIVSDEEDDKKVKQYEGEDPNKAEELSGVVTYAGVMNSKVVIRANIDQFLSDGECQLSLINNETVVYNEVARIISAASTATCEGFDIPINKLDDSSYKIIIKIEANEKTGIIEGTLNI